MREGREYNKIANIVLNIVTRFVKVVTAVTAFVCLFWILSANTRIYASEIPKSEFEDEGLYNLLLYRHDIDNDGVLETEETEAVSTIQIDWPTDLPGIGSLKGLEYYKNLNILILQGRPTIYLEDISALAYLDKLESLTIDYLTSEADYSVLYELENMKWLSFQNSDISDIGFLKNMPMLKELMLWGCDRVIDGSLIGTLTELTSLYLRCPNMKDISFIENLDKLQLVNLLYLAAEDYSVLRSSAETITNVSIGWDSMQCSPNIDVLEELTNVQSLYIEYSGLEELPDLTKHTQLTTLYIRGNYITRDEAIKKLPDSITTQSNWEQSIGLYQQLIANQGTLLENRSTDELMSKIMLENESFFAGSYLYATDETENSLYNNVKSTIYAKHDKEANVAIYDVGVYMEVIENGQTVIKECSPYSQVQVMLPIEQKGDYTYYVYRQETDGSLTLLDNNVDTELGYVYVNIDYFGTFCVAADEADKPVENDTTEKNTLEKITTEKDTIEDNTTEKNNIEKVTSEKNTEENQVTEHTSDEETITMQSAIEETTSEGEVSNEATSTEGIAEGNSTEVIAENNSTGSDNENEVTTQRMNADGSTVENATTEAEDISHTSEIVLIGTVLFGICGYEIIRRKKNILIFLVAIISVWGMSLEAHAEVIPSSEFEDQHFYGFLLGQYDEDEDGTLETEETEWITELEIYLSTEGYDYFIEGISSLDGIEYLKNLRSLYIYNEPSVYLTDISALEHLASLEVLLIRNQYYIPDYSVLYKLTKLKQLDLTSTNVEDISFLANMTQLKHLTLDYTTYLTEGAPIGTLAGLEYLSIAGSRIESIEYLAACTKLEVVNMSSCKIYDFEGLLSSKDTISTLIMGDYHYDYSLMLNVENLEFLREFTNLGSLSIGHSHIIELPDLTHLERLQYVIVHGNHLTIEEYMEKLPSTVFLDSKWRELSGIENQSVYIPEEIGMQETELKDDVSEIVAEGRFANDTYIEATEKQKDEHENVVEEIRQKIGDEAQINLYDISVYKFYTLDKAETVGREEKSQPEGMAKVVLPLNLEGNQVYAFRQEEDGTITQLECSVENDKVIFFTDHFSIFSIAAMLLVEDVEINDIDIKDEEVESSESIEENTVTAEINNSNQNIVDNSINNSDDTEDDRNNISSSDIISSEETIDDKLLKEKQQIIDIVVICVGIIGMSLCETMRRRRNKSIIKQSRIE